MQPYVNLTKKMTSKRENNQRKIYIHRCILKLTGKKVRAISVNIDRIYLENLNTIWIWSGNVSCSLSIGGRSGYAAEFIAVKCDYKFV